MNNDYWQWYKDAVDRNWFMQCGNVNPDIAMRSWEEWMGNSTNRYLKELRYFYKAAELAVGRKNLLRFYLSEKPEDHKHVGEPLKVVFDGITEDLSIKLPRNSIVKLPEYRKRHLVPKRTNNDISLITRFSGLTSSVYYLKVLDEITCSSKSYNLSVAIHNVVESDLFEPIEKILRIYPSSGLLFIRKAPDKITLRYINRKRLPVMLINADEIEYDAPVIGNIVPFYPESTALRFRQWLTREINPESATNSKKVVIAGMKPEKPEDYHRKNRLAFMIRNIKSAGLDPTVYYLPDYGFENALSLWQLHKDALYFICLSDQMAVALKHILIAAGENYHNRIVGFDNSYLSQKENIPSFGQKLEEFGQLAIKRFAEVFEQMKKEDDFSFQYKIIPVEVLFHERF